MAKSIFLSLSLIIAANLSFGATILTFDTTDKNLNLDSTYGSFATESIKRQGNGKPGYTVEGDGTPNIGLLFAPTKTTGVSEAAPKAWQTWHQAGTPWAGGVGQMENENSSITFTPNIETAGVHLESFSFMGYGNSDSYKFLVRVLDLSDNNKELFSEIYEWTNSASYKGPSPDLDIKGEGGHILKLELTRQSGAQNDIAIDNLKFSQLDYSSIPEPTAVSLLGSIFLVTLLRRKK